MGPFRVLISDMTTIEPLQVELGDAELVAECLIGNRDAFRQIVERYQTLISSLAYCATGSLSQSEDLAQETFVNAWQQLEKLRDPAKLRSWLGSITRSLVSKQFRREGREPSCAAESLESVFDWASPAPSPPEQAITEEEKIILWRALERIPEIYREPLVLFYREQQSIETVAHDLGLSEDAVKQRLSRGRKLLQEQFLSFVAGALKKTNPGKTFTVGVIAALPLMATTAKAAVAGTSAAKSGAIAKVTGLGAIFQAIGKAVAGAAGMLSPILLLGGYFGFKMGGDARQSPSGRESVATFWRIIVGCLTAFVLCPILLLILLRVAGVDFTGAFKQRLLGGLTIWLGLMYALVPAALFLWAWQRRKPLQAIASQTPPKKWFGLWLLIAMIGTAGLLVFCLMDANWKVQYINAAGVQKMVVNGVAKEAEFSILQHQDGESSFWITLRKNGKVAKFSAPVDNATVSLLKDRGIKCPIYVQGRDFEVFGWPGRFLPGFCIFILMIGAVVLLRRPGNSNPRLGDAQQKL